jgi:hypothetical protein
MTRLEMVTTLFIGSFILLATIALALMLVNETLDTGELPVAVSAMPAHA